MGKRSKCHIDNCSKFSYRKQLCYEHFKEQFPDELKSLLQYRRETERCQIEGCNKLVQRRKLCNYHLKERYPEIWESVRATYARWFKLHGKERKKHSVCHIEGCNKQASERKGLCVKHLKVYHPIEAKILLRKLRERQLCRIDGCYRFKVKKNLCQTHLKEAYPELYEKQIHNHGLSQKTPESKQREKSRHQLNRERVFYAYTKGTMKCQCPRCDVSNLHFLTIHHINNDGAEHKKTVGNKNFYTWLIEHNFPPGFQVLCYNCNCSKGATRVCGHFRKQAGSSAGN